MNNLNGYKICGKPGGSSFLDAKRPFLTANSTALSCEPGWLPCDSRGSVEFTVCYPVTGSVANDCPITSISFKNNDATQITLSKIGTNLPIVTFRMTVGVPCLDPTGKTSLDFNSNYFTEYGRD